MDFIIEAELEDIDQLAELFDYYRIFYQQLSDLQGAKQFLTDRISNGESKIYIAIHSDAIIGFVQLYPIFSSTKMKRMWLLNDLFVLSEYRGRGISKQLIEHCKLFCEANHASGLLLETAKSNEVGNCLYPKAGFKLDTDHNYYCWDTKTYSE